MKSEQAIARQLNPQQAQAVEHREGPLRIIAGAGAGKTETLAQSVIDLVRDGYARPDQILAITFTRKASADLRRRMGDAIATVPGAIGEVDVDTYNAFGSRVVQQHGFRIGLPPNLTMLTEARSWILLWRVIDEIDFTTMDWSSPRGHFNSGNSPIHRILRIAGRLADERRDTDDLHQFSTMINHEEEPDLADIVKALERYDARKRELGALDFGDQIRLACDLLERDDVRDFYADAYRYVLVDEFQDTNFSQRTMVRALGASVDGNIRIVGDPNQAIYGFRGAAPDNMDGFLEDFPDAQDVPLNRNYRSTQQILDAANTLWDSTPGKFRGDLVSGLDKTGTKPILAGCPDLYTEAAFIARQMHEFRDEGIEWKNMAILVRKNKPALRLYNLLIALGIPVEISGGGALLEQSEVRLLHSAIRVIGGDEDDVALAHVLSSDRWGIDEASLYSIARDRDRNERLLTTCRRVVLNPDTAAAGILRECLGRIEDLTAFAYTASALQVFDRVSRSLLGALDIQQEANIGRFRAICRQFAEEQTGEVTLRDLLVYLDLLESSNADDEATPAETTSTTDTVKLMTMHSAKGLEWPIVFISMLNSQDSDRISKLEPDVLPPELVQPARDRPIRSDYPVGPVGRADYKAAIEVWREEQAGLEDRRLLYVALTRAEDHLFLTWSATDPTRSRSYSVSGLIEDISDQFICVQPQPVDPPDPKRSMMAFAATALPRLAPYLDDVHADFTSWTVPAALISEDWEQTGGDPAGLPFAFGRYVEARTQLENDIDLVSRIAKAQEDALAEGAGQASRSLTYSQFEQFKRCPHRWYLRNHVGLPGIPDRSAAQYGTDVHSLIQRDAESRANGETGGIPAANRPVDPASGAIRRGDASAGRHDPIDAYLRSIDAAIVPMHVEAEFTFTIGDVAIDGVIDRVHRHPNGYLEVVDYKTDRYLRSEAEIRDGLQLQIYLIAMRRSFPNELPHPAVATMFFLRHNERIQIAFTEDDLHNAERQILANARQMQTVSPLQHNASPGICGTCEFRLSCRFSQATEFVTTGGSSPSTIT